MHRICRLKHRPYCWLCLESTFGSSRPTPRVPNRRSAAAPARKEKGRAQFVARVRLWDTTTSGAQTAVAAVTTAGSWRRLFSVQCDAVENRLHDRLFPNPRIDHQVIDAAGRPLYVEVFLDEISSLGIDDIDQPCRFLRIRAAVDQPLDLLFVGRIDEYVKRIRAICKKECGSAADDDAIPFFSSRID